jgi:hypothetical protein
MSTGTDNQEMVEHTDTRSPVSVPLPVLEHNSGKESVGLGPCWTPGVALRVGLRAGPDCRHRSPDRGCCWH